MKIKKEALASIALNYNTIVLPLATAHKIQELLTEAVRLEDVWISGKGKITQYVKEYEVPSVNVVMEAPVHDATGLNRDVVEAWIEALSKAEGDALISLKDFARTYGE